MNGQSAVQFPGNARVHIALGVGDLSSSRAFYQTLFGVPPTKERPGYVKFEPLELSVNLTLNEGTEAAGTGSSLTHYGVQVKSTQAVQEAISRLSRAGLATRIEENATCCYAVQDKVWVADPDGNQWEVFVVLEADANQRKDPSSCCCRTDSLTASTSSCC